MMYVDMLISALGQGIIYAPMALGIFIAFRILNTPDLTIDGSFVFGMAVCAIVTIGGHPVLGILAGILAGMAAGLVTGFLQTTFRINPILSGILTMTGLYTVNYAVLGGQSNRYLQSMVINKSGVEAPVSSRTIYKMVSLSENGAVSELILSGIIVVILVVMLAVFFKTRPGLALRATGDNEEMVRTSSINANLTRRMGIMLANGLVALSGAMLCQQQRYADLGNGNGMLVVGLASVIIGQAIFGKRGVTLSVISAVVGSVLYRIILQAAYQIDMPSYTVKLISALIVAISLTLPLIKEKIDAVQMRRSGEGRVDR
ncbi:ABC transporter permease [Youngiibacter multivorans]|uniref:ABC transport system permease protein n=1 Tax=Youngiibacter multivorans TaxID=937251 RepID=A0ABS4G113_9CLOT|nr:ABC transporter permease [Youngiibacter multivorans]MBP1918229.1 putative ABC transport system permease protein [Youngiibacter multivorans]